MRNFPVLALVLVTAGWCEAKMCWEECRAGAGVVETADILGCRRRSTYPARQDFRCQGRLGPPCTVFRGDTVRLDVNWVNPGIRDMTQSTHWVSWVELPWVGMETEACPYLDGGAGCVNNTVDIIKLSSASALSLTLFYLRPGPATSTFLFTLRPCILQVRSKSSSSIGHYYKMT